jgi:hypothetical protein
MNAELTFNGRRTFSSLGLQVAERFTNIAPIAKFPFRPMFFC